MTFTITENRCILNPRDSNYDVATLKGPPCKFFRAASVAFAFHFRDEDGNPLDVSNITSFNILIKSSSTVVFSKSFTPPTATNSVTNEEFENGSKEHIRCELTGTDTNLTEGSYTIVFWGYASGAEKDVFGVGTLIITDAGLTSADPTISVTPPEWLDIIYAELANRVTYGENPAGKTVVLKSSNGSYGRELGCTDDGEMQSDLKEF